MQKKYFGRTTNIRDIAGTKRKALRMKRFMYTVGSIVLGFIAVAFVFTYIYVHTLVGSNVDILKGLKDNTIGSVINLINKCNKNRLTGLVIGVDKQGLRTDVMFVATVDKEKGKIDVISIPRDTRIKISQENLLKMKKARKRVPSSGIVKINAVNAYALDGERAETTVSEIEKILDVEIDYYAKVDIKAFRKIIDTIGGVKFNVPKRMKYWDPTQNLNINLYPGEQVLDGRKAEQLVRYRKYYHGDLDRIKVQQDFLKSAYKQVFSVKNIGKLDNIALILYEYIDTNFGLADVPEAISVASKINLQNVSMYTLPGEPQYINNVSYFIYNKEKTKELVNILWEKDKENIENQVITDKK